jgi:uncharacterized protein (TIGR03435 family)
MRTILLASLSGALLFAQAPSNLQFEVASVRPSQPSPTDRVDIGLHLNGAQVRINTFPMREYIARAYRVKPYQVTGPDWIISEKYDVNAKLPDGATADQIPEMLQKLLEERFQLKVHREKKELPVYVLSVGKAPLKIQPTAPDASDTARKGELNVAASGSAAGVAVDLGNGAYYNFANGKFELHKVSMELLARSLERYVDRPILDSTGLAGNYDVMLNVTPEDAQTMMIRVGVNSGVSLPPQVIQAMENGSIASLLDAFEKLGLKMEARKAPVDVIVVDQGSKTPTAN